MAIKKLWKISIIIIMILFLFSFSGAEPTGDVRSITKQNVKSICTFNTKIKEYNDGTVNVLIGGQRYANSSCTKIEDVPSLKDCEFCDYVELIIKEDEKYPVEENNIKDYNTSAMELCLKTITSELNKDIPLEVYAKSNETDIKFSTDVNLKTTTEEKCYTIPFGFDKVIKWGPNSTLIQLGGSEKISSTYLSETFPDNNFGSSNLLFSNVDVNDQKHIMLSWNTTLIPAGVTIIDAQIALNLFANFIDGAEFFDVEVHHLFGSFGWNETNITWNTGPTAGTDYNATIEDAINFVRTTPTGVYYNWNVTKMMKVAHGNGETNLSMYMGTGNENSVEAADDLQFESADAGDVNPPYLNITYEAPPPVWVSFLNSTPNPVTVTNDIKYNASGTSINNYYLTVCSSDSVTNGNCTDTFYCSSVPTTSGSDVECNYTATVSDEGAFQVFGFLCDSVFLVCGGSNTTTTTVQVDRPAVSNVAATPSIAANGTSIRLNATVTDDDSFSVKAVIFFPNSTFWQNLSMSLNAGDEYNVSLDAPKSPLGTYNFTISVNDSDGNVNDSEGSNFTSYITLADTADITINGSFEDWESIENVSDVIGDTGGGGGEDIEFVLERSTAVAIIDWDGTQYVSYNVSFPGTFDSGQDTSEEEQALGDTDGDGDIEKISWDSTLQNLSVFFWNGTSSEFVTEASWDPTGAGTQVWGIAAGDLLRGDDGKAEIAILNGTANPLGLQIWAYNGTDYVLNQTLVGSFDVFGLYIEDLDGDDEVELISGDGSSNLIIYDFNDSGQASSLLVAYTGTSNQMTEICFGNTDEDEIIEIVGKGSSSNIQIFEWNGTGYIRNASLVGTDTGSEVTCGNFDGLNNTNAYHHDDKGVYSYNGTGYSRLYVTTNIPDPEAGIYSWETYAFDLDGDGKDEVADNTQSNVVEIYSWNGSDFNLNSSFSSPGSAGNAQMIQVGDIDNDGGAGGENPAFDIKSTSVANGATDLFIRMEMNNTLDFSGSTEFYRVYVSTLGDSGNFTSPEGNSLPFAYNFLFQVNGTQCYYTNSTDYTVNKTGCSVANDTNNIEFGVTFASLDISVGTVVNITVETGSSTQRYDMGIPLNGFISFTTVSVADTDGPTYSNFLDNSTASAPTNATDVQLNVTVTDATNVDWCQIATNNTDGNTMTNQTLFEYDSTPITVITNESIAWFPTTGGTMGWQMWCNDTGGFVSTSTVQTVTIQPIIIDSCSPTGLTNHTFECSDNCTITSTIDFNTNNITANGPGILTLEANITNWRKLTINNCNVTCRFGGCFI